MRALSPAASERKFEPVRLNRRGVCFDIHEEVLLRCDSIELSADVQLLTKLADLFAGGALLASREARILVADLCDPAGDLLGRQGVGDDLGHGRSPSS